MNAESPIDTLRDLARDARDSAGRLLNGERQSHRQAEARLESLYNYRREYARRLQEAMGSGIDNATLANYREFLRSLDTAIERAEQAVGENRERVSASEQHWRQQQKQLSSYEALASRRARDQRREEARREMRQQDEITNNALIRARQQKKT